MASAGFSSGLRLTDLDDFIAPSQVFTITIVHLYYMDDQYTVDCAVYTHRNVLNLSKSIRVLSRNPLDLLKFMMMEPMYS